VSEVGLDGIEGIIGEKIYFAVPFEKMESMEFLEAMLAEMKEELLAKSEADHEEGKAERRDEREHMQEMTKTNQEKADADPEHMQ
jgi:hypothetical protein